MRMKKATAFGLAALMAATMIPAVPAMAKGDDSEGSVYYLNFKPEQADQWSDLAKKYTDETGVPVTVVTAASGTYESTLKSEMAKDEVPTLFQVNGPVGLASWKDYCYDLKDSDVYKNVESDDFVLKEDSGADKDVQERLASWMRTAVGIMESSHIRVCRVADNMRNVAVTEGDKVEAQIKFGWEVDAYPVNEIADYVKDVAKGDVDALVDEYYSKYDILLEGRDPEEFKRHVAVQAQIEIGFEKFLEEKNYQAIVTHFGDLGALKQLPGLAIQRLMEKGYGFGAEGDWKTAAMVRLMKIMTAGVKDAKGTSMMEDYTYNFVPGKEGILQSHMLEVCPSVADGKIGIKVCPLSMGDREDPARLVFTSKTGPGIATSLIDLGDRFRLIINDVECKKVEKPMPKLPVGSAFWTPQPNLKTGAEAWILAGGAHHTAFSYDLTAEQMGDWAAAMGIEAVYIDKDTNIRDFKNELRWNELAFRK